MQIGQSTRVSWLSRYMYHDLALRLQILERRDPYLLEALTALLMILPQGKIFNMLKSRLEVAKLVGSNEGAPASVGGQEIDV